ncbi:MAG TPA: beta-galactosidase [Clostridiales bacterium]|nr:beta-galactosidase [Clostridiales bacterium]
MYRPEHPKPQFMRENWLNLNGEWDFELDNGRSGIARKMYEDGDFSMKINVPFCPQSKLSGLEILDFMYGVWYRRTINLTADRISGKTFIHFGAVDYKAYVYINGKQAGTHSGGYISFKFDISDLVIEGENTIVVYAEDDERCPFIPRGKQSEEYYSHHCDYTRTTGIWLTVWLEFAPKTYIEKVKYYPDIYNVSLYMTAETKGAATLTATAYYEGKEVGKASVNSNGGLVSLTINLSEKHLWEVGKGRLYDLVLTYGDDKVNSYFGLRSTRVDSKKYYLNDVCVFQRTILDQGFYPDGIYTAPSDEELLGDIKRSMVLGFNGARLHEKIFEERFLYHAAKEGYLVWGEFPNWGLDHTRSDTIYPFLYEWLEELDRDFNQPAIIGWCPFNETWDIRGRKQNDELLRSIYRVTKAVDDTRPVIDTSGNYHVETDIFDIHDYNQNYEEIRKQYMDFLDGKGEAPERFFENRQEFNFDKPVFFSEYGGIKWSAQTENSWGYGDAPKTEEEFIDRYRGLTHALIDNPHLMGFCYTQLTDVEQEQNGLYTYDRKLKFPAQIIYEINTKKAAIED